MIIFTSICTNYAHKARTLAESVKKIYQMQNFCVFDGKRNTKINGMPVF